MSRYNYIRRKSIEVPLGNSPIGGENPVRIQSMTNTSTLDTEGSAAQVALIAGAGADIVRLTTQGVREAENMARIKDAVIRHGIDIPLVADVHFNPKAALAAAAVTDKVRINPGNFVDAARTFKKLSYTPEEYRAEIEKIRSALLPLLDICRAHGTTLRLGVNHGSLSDRIMSRYGDTPAGMVESVMEFLRICRDEDFNRIVISIKASNTVVMVETVRLLVETMDREDMHYPLHLGVTEAGDGEDGRIKSAVGIGALLAEGLGDTIRVSLSEPPEAEIPVAIALRDYIVSRAEHPIIPEPEDTLPGLARSHALTIPGFENVKYPLVAGLDFSVIPESWHSIDAASNPLPLHDNLPVVLSSHHTNRVGEMQSWIDRFRLAGARNPIVLSLGFDTSDLSDLQIQAGADFGTLLLNGYGSAIHLDAPLFSKEILDRVALGILQAARLRTSKTEYISCPGCGRTLFDLPDTLAQIRRATSHLTHLKIGVMGCIVNGPGEMADADYGYVGAAQDKISLYHGKSLIEKNIDREKAVNRLVQLIKDNGDWIDP